MKIRDVEFRGTGRRRLRLVLEKDGREWLVWAELSSPHMRISRGATSVHRRENAARLRFRAVHRRIVKMGWVRIARTRREK